MTVSKIALLNDQLRLTMATSSEGRVVPEEDVARVLDRVRRFDEWTNDNDPHGEHDFGSFDVAGVTYFFKVDYYAPDMDGGSEDPAHPEIRLRAQYVDRREAPDRLVLLQVSLPRRQARLARSLFQRGERHLDDRPRAAQGDQETPRSPVDGVSHAQIHRNRREALRMEGDRSASPGADCGGTPEAAAGAL
jgi:hypothetical protein